MRIAFLLSVIIASMCSGCTHILVNSGQNLAKLTTRDEVHRVFGKPSNEGQTGEATFEQYETRKKIAEPVLNIYLVMGYCATLGLGEMIWFPNNLYIACRRSIVGQIIQFNYDTEGRVIGIWHDGDAVFGVKAPDKK